VTPNGAGGARPLLASVACFGLAVIPVRRDRVGRAERALFTAVNGLPDAVHPPIWLVMQGGALGAVPITAAAAAALGRPQLAARLAISGTATYVLAKGIKSVVRRGRPPQLLPNVRVRGGEAGGPGFVSGHAGVSMSLVTTLLPGTGPLLHPVLLAVPVLVGLGRMYVGAHLPLDVAGGAAFGRAVSAGIDYFAGGLLGTAQPAQGRYGA
jgi:membrane-associated phospholipid phosphatase